MVYVGGKIKTMTVAAPAAPISAVAPSEVPML